MDVDNIEQPEWLRIMQNGTLGEARTKAFLLERFWVLERSVDINGADFIIQPRILKKDLFNTTPVNFGVVQVKYYESKSTTQYIPVDYFFSEKNEPRKDFFVILSTGKEDNSKMYFLTAEDIYNDFPTAIKKTCKVAKLTGRDVLIDKYVITSKTQCLNRIEHILHQATFENNRKFLSKFILFPDYSIESIDVEYTESIPNGYGDIPNAFCKLKDELESISSYLDDIYSDIYKIISEQNPLIVLDLIQDYKEKFEDVETKNRRFLSEYYERDFSSAIEYHDVIYKLLKRDGLLDYIKSNQENLFQIVSKVINEKSWTYDTVLELHIQLCKNAFEIDSISCTQRKLSHDKINEISMRHFYKNVKWINDMNFSCLYPVKRWDFTNETSKKSFFTILNSEIFNQLINKKYEEELKSNSYK